MGMEHGYMRWMRGTVGKPKDSPGCMAMISLVSFSMININYCLITRSMIGIYFHINQKLYYQV